MNGCEFTKAYDRDPIEVIDLVVGKLVRKGYVLKKRTTTYIHLKIEGNWYASSLLRHSHHIYITPQTNQIHFEFTTGVIASYWTQPDRQAAEERIEAAMTPPSTATDNGPFREPASVREVIDGKISCPHCDTLSPVNFEACVGCGSTRL